MTLPEEYKKTDDFNSLPRPNTKWLSSRPIIGPPLLEIPTYKIEFILITHDKSYNKLEAVLRTDDKSYNKLDTMEVRPLELDASILFYNSKSKEGPLLPIASIKDIKSTSLSSGIFRKKEKIMIEVAFYNRDKESKTIRINLEDKKINEFIQNIKLIQNKLQDDDTFWTTSLLKVKTETDIISSIKIHPAIPFLSQGEEIVWKNIITNEGIKNMKIISWLDLVTNYRIFQYNYMDHKGHFILIDEIKDIVVNNHRQKFNSITYETYAKSRYSINDYVETETDNLIIGDIVVTSDGKPNITFKNISNPNRLTAIIESMKKRRNFVVENSMSSSQINDIHRNNNKYKKFNYNEISTPTFKSNNSIICSNCNNENMINSRFCIRCGQKLNNPNKCTKCNQVNVIDALFCNMCGNKL